MLSACGRFLQESPSVGGLSIGVLSGLAFSDVEEDAILDKLRSLVFELHRGIAAKSAKEIWVEKTAFDIFHLEQIERLCSGHCRFICMHRHPLDVIVSVKDLCDGMDQILPELHVYVRQHQSLYDAFAHAWMECNTALMSFIERHPGDCLLLKYEDLLENSDRTIAELFRFMGVNPAGTDFIDRLFERASKVGLGDWKTYGKRSFDRNSVARWRTLHESTLARLVPLLAPQLMQLGYEVPQTVPPKDRKEAVHLYRLAKQMRQILARPGATEG